MQSSIINSLEKSWGRIEKILQRKGFKTTILSNERSLRKFIYDTIPDNCIVGLGNSLSSSALKIRNILLEKGNKVYYNWNGNRPNRDLDSFEEQPAPDFFLTTADSITGEGNIINHEYSKKAFKENRFPRNIITFSAPGNLLKKISHSALSSDFTILNTKPSESEVTVALLPF